MTSDVFSILYVFFPSIGELGSLLGIRPSDYVIIAISTIFIISFIALFAFLTKSIFLRVQEIPRRTNQIYLLLCFFFGMIFMDILEQHLNHISAILILLYVLLRLFLGHIWWIAAVILPTYFICPEIREKKLGKIVVVCFMLTVIFRNFLGYFYTQTIGHGFGYGYPYPIVAIFPMITQDSGLLYDVSNISITICLAFAGYWVIGQLIRRVPRVKRWLAVE